MRSRARRTISGDEVAIKHIPVGSATEAVSARAEAALLGTLDHPNLVRLVEFVPLDGAVALVLELADGGSLADLLRRRDTLTPAEIAGTFSLVAAALHHAHGEGIIHGDVSAANILFSGSGQPQLADLGVARLFGSSTSAMGTPAYIDPAVAGGGAAGAATDVFALAAVALHALTGRGPWQQTSAPESGDTLLARAATATIADLEDRLSVAPPGMAATLARALDPEPFRRGTAAEFALDLRSSTQPTAVVLTAGRRSPSVGRHAALSGAGAGSYGFGNAAFVPPDLTHVARPRARPEVVACPPSKRRAGALRLFAATIGPRLTGLRGWAPGRDAIVAVGTRLVGMRRHRALLAVVAFAVAAGFFTAVQLHAMGRPHGATLGTAPLGTATAPLNQAFPTRDPAATNSPAPDPALLLSTLDSRRESAFAQRRTDLLAHVYAAPELLDQDTRQLNALVPVGCQLVGLHTRYDQVAVLAQTPGRLEMRAVATLSAAEVRCSGLARVHTAPAGPSVLTLVLTADAGGYRISSQRVSTS
jgi:hypothetical protein